jgi:hypothetical protein
MTSRILLRLAEILVPVILAITIFVSWEADRRDRAQLAAQLAAAQKTITDAAASQHDRDTLLNQTLAQLAVQKQAAETPTQILKDLPAAIALPAPITLQAEPAPAPAAGNPAYNPAGQPGGTAGSLGTKTSSAGSQALPNTTAAAGSEEISAPNPSGDAVLPAADLKPLYDFAMDCKVCQAKLAAAQSDLNDEKTENAALTKEKDDAVTAAKGGGVLRRILRAAKWFAIGAAAGAVAAKAAR